MSEQLQVEANKKIVRDYVQRVFNEHQPDLANDFVTPDVVWHGGILGDVAGAENVTGILRSFIGPFPTCKLSSRTSSPRTTWSWCDW
jgi:hypothetical protein